MSPTHFADRLAAAVRRAQTPVLVGLDPRAEQLPPPLAPRPGALAADVADAFRRFACEVIDVVAGQVAAVKPQAAFFEQLGPPGFQALADVIAYARQAGLLVILDGKRNDIGSTAAAYADAYLESAQDGEPSSCRADALTVSPYLGEDSLEPFVETAGQRGAGVFVLVKTSNPGGHTFQDLVADGRPLYRHVAELVERLAAQTAGKGGYGLVGGVVGATYPDQLAELRAAMPHAWILVPGYGAQGGTARDVAAAFDPAGLGALVNNSRGIIFAYSRPEYARFRESRWQDAVAAATRQMIDELRAETPAGRLLA